MRHVRSSHKLSTRGYDMLREYAHCHIILFKFIENKEFMHHLRSLLCVNMFIYRLFIKIVCTCIQWLIVFICVLGRGRLRGLSLIGNPL